MKRGQILEGVVKEIDFPNRGVVSEEGRIIHVKHTLPGQKIRFRITKTRSGKCEGQLLNILDSSPDEVMPDCPHYGMCGGCEFRTLPYDAQLSMKENQVRSLLLSVCEEPGFYGIKASPVRVGYRNKMEFSFGDVCKDGPMALGMHRRGGFYDIVTTDRCRIVDGDFRCILTTVLDLAQRSGLTFYHRLRHEGYFRHLLVRKAAGTGEILVDLVTSTQAEPEKEREIDAMLTETLLEKQKRGELKGILTGILHTRNDSVADIIQNDRTDVLWGNAFFYEKLLDLRFRITPFSFFQTNSAGAEVLYQTVREYAGDTKDKVIFDLYSGTGTIAQILAPVAKQVTGVEIIPEAVEAARENARINGLSNCSFLTGDVLKVVDELESKPDLIVLDPPRDGIHPKALRKIIDFGVSQIVYVSCKPTSLIRDLEILQQNGYRVEKSCCVDMFPDTGNVETIVLITRNTT